MEEWCSPGAAVSLGMEPGGAGCSRLRLSHVTKKASRKGDTDSGPWQTGSMDAPEENSEDLHGGLW